MANKRWTRLIILALLALAHIEAICACTPSHIDGVWQTINSHSIIDDARTYSEAKYSEKGVKTKLGRPDMTYRDKDGEISLYWIRGARRESRSDDCKGRLSRTFTVAYAILKLSFKDGAQTNCHVLERAFVSSKKHPDPFRETNGQMPSSLRSCASFVASQTEN